MLEKNERERERDVVACWKLNNNETNKKEKRDDDVGRTDGQAADDADDHLEETIPGQAPKSKEEEEKIYTDREIRRKEEIKRSHQSENKVRESLEQRK